MSVVSKYLKINKLNKVRWENENHPFSQDKDTMFYTLCKFQWYLGYQK